MLDFYVIGLHLWSSNLFAKTCINFIFFKSIWFQVPTKFISKIIITLSLTLTLYCSFLGTMHAWCFPLKVFEETKHYDLLSFIYLYIYTFIYIFSFYIYCHLSNVYLALNRYSTLEIMLMFKSQPVFGS